MDLILQIRGAVSFEKTDSQIEIEEFRSSCHQIQCEEPQLLGLTEKGNSTEFLRTSLEGMHWSGKIDHLLKYIIVLPFLL